MTWTFTIPRPVPSRNERLSNRGSDAEKGRYRRLRDGWATDLIAMKAKLRIPPAIGPRRVTITRLMAKREKSRDVDGNDVKIILDALKRETVIHEKNGHGVSIPVGYVAGAGLIHDDSRRWCVLAPIVEERAADGIAACRIEIEDITIEAAEAPGREAR